MTKYLFLLIFSFTTYTARSEDWVVDDWMVETIGLIESANKPLAVSVKGARGRYQFMESTWKDVTTRVMHKKEWSDFEYAYDPKIAKQVCKACLIDIKKRLGKTLGTQINVAAAYNAGVGAVIRYKGVPPYKETQNYVKRFSIHN